LCPSGRFVPLDDLSGHPNVTYFKKKKFHLRRDIFQILGEKTPIREETPQNIENDLF
jgi:hypothetical protein